MIPNTIPYLLQTRRTLIVLNLARKYDLRNHIPALFFIIYVFQLLRCYTGNARSVAMSIQKWRRGFAISQEWSFTMLLRNVLGKIFSTYLANIKPSAPSTRLDNVCLGVVGCSDGICSD